MVLPVVNALALDAVPLNVPVIVPVEKPPLLSLLTIVFGVLSDVAEFTAEATVVIVDELTPPTLFTVGASAEPPKSLVNCNLPFTNAVASGVIEPVTCAATKAVVAICVELVPGAAVTAVGVPVKAGLVDNTTDPVPVDVFVPVPPLVIANGVVNVNVPDDIAVAVIVPASKLPLPSLLTIVPAVLDEVAESTFDATVVIVDEFTPPTVLIVVVNDPVPLPLTSPVNVIN